ncbi:hypothetical protein A2U01_0007522 [Trifolium medium]|uniref:Uncharacterized protein n=1 Tax=Trifolium medium TaxID=97028 RepID=A0A392MGN1_9FABA|nr:hypothetical protein [Trifolium medium]
MMAIWDELDEAFEEEDQQGAKLCLMTHSNTQENGHAESFCYRKKRQHSYRKAERSQNNLPKQHFSKPPYKRSSYQHKKTSYKIGSANLQGPTSIWVPKNLLNVGMSSSKEEKAMVLGQWLLKAYDQRQTKLSLF